MDFQKSPQKKLLKQYYDVRRTTENICKRLEIEDYVVQTKDYVSPPKWHLGHTAWFFDAAFLLPLKCPTKQFHYFKNIFNSYYKGVGEHWLQSKRGILSRPTVEQTLDYRKNVDKSVLEILDHQDLDEEYLKIIELGLHHEQQHQELLYMDIKNILFHAPFHAPYEIDSLNQPLDFKTLIDSHFVVEEGVYEFGQSEGFYFDNEFPVHKRWITPFELTPSLVNEVEYVKFMEDKGYENPKLWLSDGWDWIQNHKINSPLYWNKTEEGWRVFTLTGWRRIDASYPVSHISLYEADAFARWSGRELPTEFELEHFFKSTGQKDYLWNWSRSSYEAYPGYRPYEGLLSEYNGKFMVNQYVLRGGCTYTPEAHYRPTYRNFYRAYDRWAFTGLRLCRRL
ncbi:MAG: ergothioneine biosynthesis protein EgtB [Bdellovibrionales bacterium]|nr:ergothioneine biosynthesis protein EgtB [Bdellovibrionales bacterium]